MNAYFFKMSKDEKNNILDQHKHLYDGYVTKYNQESNQYPLYVQDLANDKNGITLTNKGDIKNYTNHRVNESPLDRIGDGPNDLKNGTVDFDRIDYKSNSNYDMMHDIYPSPNEEEEEYMSVGKNSIEDDDNLDIVIDIDPDDRFEFDIDEIGDYSSGEIKETEKEIDVTEVADEDKYEVLTDINESLKMFKRFKKYN